MSFFHVNLKAHLLLHLFSQHQVGSHYILVLCNFCGYLRLKSNIKPFLLSYVYLTKFIFSISFSIIHLKPSVGRYWLYMKYHLSFLFQETETYLCLSSILILSFIFNIASQDSPGLIKYMHGSSLQYFRQVFLKFSNTSESRRMSDFKYKLW